MTPGVSHLLDRLRGGDESALNDLVKALYNELHLIAARHLRGERPGHTLQATALVHEAYLKLIGDHQRGFADRVHFLAVVSRVMRQVLVDYARARATKKRDGNATFLSVDMGGNAGAQQMELLDLDRALEWLADEDKLLAQLIEMRYFGGMTAEEMAQALGLSPPVVKSP